MDWSSILSQARNGSLVFWAGFAAVAASLTLVTAALYVRTRRSIARRRGAIDGTKAEQPGTYRAPAEPPPNSVRAAVAYGQQATDTDPQEALLARLQRTSARMEQMVAESQREA